MIKVLLVDDHELVRSGIEALLNAMDDITVIAACDCGEQALELIDKNPPDVILMDINMPGMGGLEACRRILNTLPEIKLIGLSAYDNGQVPRQLLRLGVEGFVSKGSPVIEMVDAIRAVMSGKRHIRSESIQASENSIFAKLSQRELEVAGLILQGKSIPDMADTLQINAKTVNTYRYRLYEKLNIKNDVELMHLAVKFNILNSEILN
ncbi:response regulator [Methylomonas sp. AM2-LC]|uniref:response regulator n=1 Tax=Methylomonas sp. AM2-LC TaxID=3153301 RepID=UPI003266EF46